MNIYKLIEKKKIIIIFFLSLIYKYNIYKTLKLINTYFEVNFLYNHNLID